MFGLLYILCVTISLAKAGIVEGNSCETVDSEMGRCVKITECHPIYDLLLTMPIPYPKTVIDYAKRLYCGRVGKIPMICCPSETGGIRPYADLSNHKNAYLLTKNTCGISNTLRLAGGIEAYMNEFPWIALLIYDKGLHCTGSVISDRYVLTAAHCITEDLRRVRIGEHNINSSTDCESFLGRSFCAPPYQEVDIEKTIVHELFSWQIITDDVALIRVASPIDFTVLNTKPICLPIYGNLRNSDFTGKDMTVIGWGLNEEVKQSDVLLNVAVKVISKDECKARCRSSDSNRNFGYIVSKKICADTLDQNLFRGDSGGPLVNLGIYDNRVRYIQQGIASYGLGVCSSGTTSVYVRVDKYVKWILDHIEP